MLKYYLAYQFMKGIVMGNKRKNSNYVTEKTEKAKADKARAEKKKRILKTVIPCICVVLVIALIFGIYFLGKALGWFYPSFEDDNPQIENKQNDSFKATHHAAIEVEGYGTIHIELYGEEAPETVANFVKLANDGFYDGLTFHRIIDDFMAQGGDPEADGTGNADKTIKGEFKENGVKNDIKHVRGTISMARLGDDKNGASCQFFIVDKTSTSNTKSLDGKYAAFGMVTSGMNVIDKICYDADPTDDNGTIEKDDQPVIKSITIHESH